MSISGKLWKPTSDYNVFNLSSQAYSVLLILPPILLLLLLFLLLILLLLLLPPLLLPWVTGESPSVSPVMDRQHHFCSMCCKSEIIQNLHVLLFLQYFPRGLESH